MLKWTLNDQANTCCCLSFLNTETNLFVFVCLYVFVCLFVCVLRANVDKMRVRLIETIIKRFNLKKSKLAALKIAVDYIIRHWELFSLLNIGNVKTS